MAHASRHSETLQAFEVRRGAQKIGSSGISGMPDERELNSLKGRVPSRGHVVGRG
jgi:hypothetical protein